MHVVDNSGLLSEYIGEIDLWPESRTLLGIDGVGRLGCSLAQEEVTSVQIEELRVD